MTDVARLGPLVAGPDGTRLDAVAGCGCVLSPAGVELWSPAGREQLAWADVSAVRVAVPIRRRWLQALPELVLAVGSWTAPDLPGRRLTVSVSGRWGGGPEADLGRVGPYGWREAAAVDTLLSALADRHRRLSALGDPALAAALLTAAAAVRPRAVPTAIGTVLGR